MFLLVSNGEYKDVFLPFTFVKSTVAKSQPGIEFKYSEETNNRDIILYVVWYYLPYVVLGLSFVCLMFLFNTWKRRLIT